MQNSKPLQFNGTPGQYLVVAVVSVVCAYLPIFGWAYLLNFASTWIFDNSLVNGRKVTYHAEYMESLKFVFVNTLLLIVTFGIYTIWYVPKMYRYVVDHVHYDDELPVAAKIAAAATAVSVDPTNPPVAS